jgi:nicotinic acid mononucleotide adenylyltransferase
VKSILAKRQVEKLIIIPSSVRNDKAYHVTDEHRLAMLEIFVDELVKAERIEEIVKVEKIEILEKEQILRSSG